MRAFGTSLVWLAGLLCAGELLAQTVGSQPRPGPLGESSSPVEELPPTAGDQTSPDAPAIDSVDCPIADPAAPTGPSTAGWPAEGCPEDFGPAQFVTAPPGWWGSVGYLTLTRSLYEVSPLFTPVSAVPGGYDSTFGHLQWGSGFDLRGGYRDPSDRFFDGWEARYFAVSGMSNSGWANTGGSWTFPGDPVVWPQAMVRAGIDSRVESAEWNLQHDAEGANVTWLAGVRWLRFDDALGGAAAIGPSDSLNFQVTTANSLYGGQAGVSLALLKTDTPFEVDLRLMGGLYANANSGNWMVTSSSPSTGFRRTGTAASTDLAFAGDLEFSFVYRFTEHWSAALSYEALWLQGVAVAGDQSELGRLLANATGLSSSEAAWFSGLNVGLRFRW